MNAKYLINKFGGKCALAKALRLNRSTPYKWIERGGIVPNRHYKNVITTAKKLGIQLDKEKLYKY